LSLLPKNAAVTFLWGGGEVNRHTFDDLIASHVDDCLGAAVAKVMVPSFKVRDAFRIESGGSFGMGYTSRVAVEDIKTSICREVATNDDFIVFVR
jgi:hypothetical protein